MGNGNLSQLGELSIQHVEKLLENADFTECKVQGLHDILEFIACGVFTLLKSDRGKNSKAPKSIKSMVYRFGLASPMALALIVLGLVFLRVNGFTVFDLFIIR